MRINIGRRFGRTHVKIVRIPGYVPRRFARRVGGQATPGPWWEYEIPGFGSVVFGRDRTIFGWTDPVNDA